MTYLLYKPQRNKKFCELVQEWELSQEHIDRFFDFGRLLRRCNYENGICYDAFEKKKHTLKEEIIEHYPNFVQRYIYMVTCEFIAVLYEQAIDYDSITSNVYRFVSRILHDTVFRTHDYGYYHWPQNSLKYFLEHTQTLPKEIKPSKFCSHQFNTIPRPSYNKCKTILDYLLNSDEFREYAIEFHTGDWTLPSEIYILQFKEFNDYILTGVGEGRNEKIK
jgi:hypothetical protein